MSRPTRSIEGASREAIELASRAVFANPFTEERYELDAALAQVPIERARPDSPHRAETARRALARLNGCWDELGPGGRYTDFDEPDRARVLHAMLFDTYLTYAERFDALIRAQYAAGEEPAPVDFAAACLARLRGWGMSREFSRRLFGVLYQIARAYFFLSEEIGGPSEPMRRLRARLWSNLFTSDLELYELDLWNRLEDFSLLIVGETGTGKGTAARALGWSGWIPFDERANKFEASFANLYFALNLSSVPPSLIESELFGHRKGAFTGAIRHHDGALGRVPRYGTILLDEIGEVDESIQVKLLNVLQERAFFPVGSHKPMRFEGRVLAATNRSIEERRARGSFREDFYYRLSSDVIEVPTLRERVRSDRAEFDYLIDRVVLKLIGRPLGRVSRAVREAIEALGPDYPWPGNVRELEQCARRVIVTGTYRPAPRLDERAEAEPNEEARRIARAVGEGRWTAAELLGAYCDALYDRHESYEAVGEIVGLDRRTVRKYVGVARQRTKEGDT